MSGAVSTINALIAEATDLLNNEEALTTEEAKQTLGAAIEAANNAIAEGLILETYKAQNEALNAAIKGGHDAMSAASAFETLVTEHINNFDTAYTTHTRPKQNTVNSKTYCWMKWNRHWHKAWNP